MKTDFLVVVISNSKHQSESHLYLVLLRLSYKSFLSDKTPLRKGENIVANDLAILSDGPCVAVGERHLAH